MVERDTAWTAKMRTFFLQKGCEVLLMLMGQKKRAKKSANSVKIREEVCQFERLPDALKSLKILFLTDAHI